VIYPSINFMPQVNPLHLNSCPAWGRRGKTGVRFPLVLLHYSPQGQCLFSSFQSGLPSIYFPSAKRILNEVDLIRREMGKPEQELLQIEINNAQPREVFFQALTLYKKADRMCFDHTRNTGPIPPKTPAGKILPGDVFVVLKKAMIRVRCVSDHWGIAKSVNLPVVNPYHTPSNVYMKILEVNRELNFLLDVPFSPSTVYRRVLETIQLVENLLQNRYPGIKTTELPEFVREN